MQDRSKAFDPAAFVAPSATVAATAVVSAGAWIGPDVAIGAGSFISPTAVIGLGAEGGPPDPVLIGKHCWIGPGTLIEPGVVVGDHTRIGHACTVRAKARLGRHVELASRCMICASAVLEDYARVLTGSYVCEYGRLGRHCQVMPAVMLLNDPYPPTALDVRPPILGECSIVGANAVIWPGVTLGYHAMAATFAEVHHDVPDYVLVRGQPAKPVCDVRMIRMKLKGQWVYPYPWMRHQIPDEDITRPATEALDRGRLAGGDARQATD